MRFEILNVGYASCALVVESNGNAVLFDCGYGGAGTRPAQRLRELGVYNISRLFIQNYDEDHISDLPSLLQSFHVQVLHRNKSISPEALRQIKLQTGPISTAMSSLLGMMQTYVHDVTDPPALPNSDWEIFHNDYPNFTDTNNLSSVVFYNFNGLRVVLPGDITKAGWTALLDNPRFRLKLTEVDVFIASHHGREDGYCSDVFDLCSPSVIIVSDGPIQYATQEMINTYAQHACGVSFNGVVRKVLTTRCDGSIWWTW